jgi:hypothetical protein
MACVSPEMDNKVAKFLNSASANLIETVTSGLPQEVKNIQ